MKLFTGIHKILLAGFLMFLISGNLYAQENNTEEWIKKAGEAGIEQSMLSELQTRIQNNKISDQQFQSIIKTAIAMSEENLPADIAIQKALEGFSKGIPSGRIASVVDQMHKSVGQAAKIVDPWMNKPAVQEMMGRSGQAMPKEKFRNELTKATSKSIMQNISAESVNQVLSQIGTQSVLANSGPSDIVAAMGILPDLPSTSKNPEMAGKFIARALNGGFKADELQKLPSAMKMAQQRSQLPAASVIEGVISQMKGNVPAKQILQNLFNGKVGGGPPGDIPKGLDNKGDRGNKGQGKGNGT